MEIIHEMWYPYNKYKYKELSCMDEEEYRARLILWRIAIFFPIILSVAALLGVFYQLSIQGELLAQGLATLLINVAYLLFLKKIKPKTQEEKEAKLNEILEKQRNKELSKRNVIGWNTMTTKHLMGLPSAENMVCKIIYLEDKFMFISAGNSYNLDLNKITAITILTDKEIKSSSIGEALLGYTLFGKVGGIVGGWDKTKNTNYMVFTYVKDERPESIIFEIEEKDKKRVEEWRLKFYEENPMQGMNFDL